MSIQKIDILRFGFLKIVNKIYQLICCHSLKVTTAIGFFLIIIVAFKAATARTEIHIGRGSMADFPLIIINLGVICPETLAAAIIRLF